MQAVVVSVNYGDILALTLPAMVCHFSRVTVGTSTSDTETREVCRRFPNVSCYVTDDFYADGASLNKGRVLDDMLKAAAREIGSGTGADPWIAVIDADIVLPEVLQVSKIGCGCLYGCYRRILENPADYSPSMDWRTLPRVDDRELAGYFQLFSVEDPVLAGRSVWYPREWRHAGAVDSFFAQLWPRERHVFLPMEVLHLGPVARNWWGRSTPRLDGTLPDNAAEHAAAMERMMDRRRACGGRRRGPGRFQGEKLGAAAPKPPLADSK